MRREMIERREGETSFKVRIHHDGMVKQIYIFVMLNRNYNVLYFYREGSAFVGSAIITAG